MIAVEVATPHGDVEYWTPQDRLQTIGEPVTGLDSPPEGERVSYDENIPLPCLRERFVIPQTPSVEPNLDVVVARVLDLSQGDAGWADWRAVGQSLESNMAGRIVLRKENADGQFGDEEANEDS